jgi:hypothetical protein
VQREPRPQGAERIAAPQTRQVGELRRIGHVGCLARAKLREEPREFRRINEALAHVVLAQQRDGRPARELPGPDGEGEHAPERRQLAVHRSGRGVVLRAPRVCIRRDAVRRDVQRPIKSEGRA